MIGIESFKQYFKGFENQYVIIGGTACELLMSDQELDFRATKDIDMVLIVETLSKEFGEIFGNMCKMLVMNISIKALVKQGSIVFLIQNHLTILR